MGAYDGLYSVRRIRQAHIEEIWTVEYDSGKLIKRTFYDLPPEMGRNLDVFYSKEHAETFAAGKQNAVIEHYEEIVYDR